MQNSTATLRPLKAGEILDRAFQLYRANFMVFLGAVSLALMPMFVFELLAMYFSVPPYILQVFELFIRVNVVNGAIIWVSWQLYTGQPASIFKAYWKALGRTWSLFLANFILGLIYISVPIFTVIVVTFFVSIFDWFTRAGPSSMSIFIFLLEVPLVLVGLLLGIGYAIYWYVRWGLNLPLIVIEGIGGKDALKRSWLLIKDDFRRASVVMVSASLLSYLVGFLPAYVVNIIGTYFPFDIRFSFLNILLLSFGRIISLPLTTSALVVLYYDLIVRYEGYDLKLALDMTDDGFDLLADEPVY